MDVKSFFSWLARQLWRIFFYFVSPRRSDSSKPILSYAGFCSAGKIPSHGGNVKLNLLNSFYPEAPQEANILYLVSSGLSAKAEAWAEWCHQKGIKLVWNQNGVAYPACFPDDHKRLNQRMARFLKQANFVVYQSDFCKMTADRFLGVCSGPSAIIYNAVDTASFSAYEKKSKNSADGLRLLAMGSHENPSRLTRALETLAALAKGGISARLTIAGRLVWPQAHQQLVAAIHQLGLDGRVELRGAYRQDEAPQLYRAADILLHLKYADPCPSVVIEAMACGVAIIGSKSGGLPELVGENAGELIPVPQDLEQLYVPEVNEIVDRIKKVSANLGAYSEAARQRAVERFDKVEWLRKHQHIFEQILKTS